MVRFSRHSLSRPEVLVVFVLTVGAVLNNADGVDWGDDFALYMNQARALVHGGADQVLADNRFSLAGSAATFGPELYPWGWPILVAPIYAIAGFRSGVIKLLEAGCFAVFLLAYFKVVLARAGRTTALLLVVLIGCSPIYVVATDTVLSDLPYLAFAGLSLWYLDRCRNSSAFRPRNLVFLGLLVGFACSIRREGFALVAALLAANGADILGQIRATPGRDAPRFERAWLVIPYGVAAFVLVTIKLALPGPLLAKAGPTTLTNLDVNLPYYRDVLAEQIGLKTIGRPPGAGISWYIVIIAGLAVTGLLGRLAFRFADDAPLAAYLLAHTVIVALIPVRESRYLLGITPFLLYFAVQAGRTLFALAGRPDASIRQPTLAFLVVLVVLGVTRYASTTISRVVDPPVALGPDQPAAREMFSVVRNRTGPRDVVLFFRARAMTFYTRRRAVQGSNLVSMLPKSDWYVMQKNSTYAQTLVEPGDEVRYGLVSEWENDGWTLWRVVRGRHVAEG